MKNILLIVILIILGGCASSRLKEKSESVDSVQVRVEKRVEYVPYTVYVEIPKQTSERVTPDSVSFLENDYATSEARVDSAGNLFHNLKTKPQKKRADIKAPVFTKDSIVYKTKYLKETKIQEVPHELSWFEKTQIYGFRCFLLLAILLVFKNRIISFIRLKIGK